MKITSTDSAISKSVLAVDWRKTIPVGLSPSPPSAFAPPLAQFGPHSLHEHPERSCSGTGGTGLDCRCSGAESGPESDPLPPSEVVDTNRPKLGSGSHSRASVSRPGVGKVARRSYGEVLSEIFFQSISPLFTSGLCRTDELPGSLG